MKKCWCNLCFFNSCASEATITIATIDDELYEGGTSGTDEVVLFELAMANDSNGDPQTGAVVAQNTTLTYKMKIMIISRL